jgi:hypothetical protein
MKRSLTLLLAPFAATSMLLAQSSPSGPLPSSAPPTEKPLSLMPSQPNTPINTEEIPLIPPAPILPGDAELKKKKAPKPGPSRTDAAEDALQMHIKLRAAKTKALEDPVVQAELEKAPLAKTDYDQREAYKRYYILLYSRMVKIDPTIAGGVSGRQGTSCFRQYQWRVTPTVPHDQLNLPTPIGPENAITGVTGPATTPIPRRGFGQPRIGESL